MKVAKIAVIAGLLISTSAMAQSFSVGGSNRSGAGSVSVSPYGTSVGIANRNGSVAVSVGNAQANVGYGGYGYRVDPAYAQRQGDRYQPMMPVYQGANAYDYEARYNRNAGYTN